MSDENSSHISDRAAKASTRNACTTVVPDTPAHVAESASALVIAFTHPAATHIEMSGGKGANLARLAPALPVPPGSIVTSVAYQRFIAPLRSRIQAILGRGDDVQTQSTQIQELIAQTPLPSELTDALRNRLRSQGAEGWRVAVRSSATLEDLPGAAFAGQHDTILNCRGLEAIEAAIRRCYASLWNAHAMHYRARLRLEHLDAAMAVVVQQMVEVGADDAAGVAFSVDPIQGKLTQVLINAAFGLGETVVGGECPVDEFRVDFAAQAVTEHTIAVKPAALIRAAGGTQGTQEVMLDATQAARASLTDEKCLQVAALAKEAERFFGFPQDIEWAFADGRLYLLQSRPVTFVPERWTRDESAERFPNPVTPLTWDLVEEGFHKSLNHSFTLMGLPHFGGKWFAMKDGYIYGNQNAVALYSGRMPLKIETLDDVRRAIPLLASKFTWMQDLPTLWMRDLDTYLLAIGALLHETVEDYTPAQQWDYIKRIRDVGTQYFLPNIAISLTQRTLYTALYQLLVIAVGEAQAKTLYDQLLAACPTKTVEVNTELWQLSREIRATPELMALLQRESATVTLAELPRFAAFNTHFTAFLQRHGHRELDFDAYYPTWAEAPHTVLDQLRALCELDDSAHSTRQWDTILAASSARHRLVSFMPEDLRYLTEEVIRLARVYTQLDDLEHYQTTRLTLPFRRGLRALGTALVAQGVLTEHSDIYFIPFADLDAAMVNGDYASLPATVARYKAQWQHARVSTPAWNLGEDTGKEPPTASEGVLTGLSGSPGTVEGEVFLVHSPDEFSQFPQDAILVARTTNPAWTALFYRAQGVITESGGPLSHGAVTARELGIPAVMSIRGVMTALHNGMRVRLDGTRGTVTVLETAPA